MDETTAKVERLEVIQLKAGHDCEGCDYVRLGAWVHAESISD